MGAKETAIQNGARLELSRHGILNWRNQVGAAETTDGRYIKFGLFKGSADVIGCQPYVVRQEDVGTTIGIFTSVELKTATGRMTKDQITWQQAIGQFGGNGWVIRDPAEITDLLCGDGRAPCLYGH